MNSCLLALFLVSLLLVYVLIKEDARLFSKKKKNQDKRIFIPGLVIGSNAWTILVENYI
jgi:hypothetical protein